MLCARADGALSHGLFLVSSALTNANQPGPQRESKHPTPAWKREAGRRQRANSVEQHFATYRRAKLPLLRRQLVQRDQYQQLCQSPAGSYCFEERCCGSDRCCATCRSKNVAKDLPVSSCRITVNRVVLLESSRSLRTSRRLLLLLLGSCGTNHDGSPLKRYGAGIIMAWHDTVRYDTVYSTA
jgi:hypothetical protein